MPEITNEQSLLMREASMASMAIGIGLTHLRRYDASTTGYFYHSMLSLCTGIERLLKLIVIYDYRLEHDGAYPNNATLKGFGHRIGDLYARALDINRRRSLGVRADFITTDPIYGKIILFLTDFANRARYYNLDSLSGHPTSTDEPLRRWDTEINSVILDRHYRQKLFLKNAEAFDSMMGSFSSFWHLDEQGNTLDRASQMFEMSQKIPIKQKYSFYYIYVLIRFGADLILKIEWHGSFFPELHEYFILFRNYEDKYILNKKSWNPLPPYKF